MIQAFSVVATRGIPLTAIATWVVCGLCLAGCSGYSDSYAVAQRGNQLNGMETERAELAHAAEKFVSVATPGSTSYKVGPQDVLDIAVFQAPELTRIIQVSEAGTISMPLAGEIVASGRTAAEVERALAAKLGARYLKSPQVTVFVKEYNSQRVTVEGAVKKPGVYPLRGHDTLMQALARAEGLDKETASTDVVVFRVDNGIRSARRFDISDIRDGRIQDPPIQASDVIVVGDSMAKSAFNIFVKIIPLGTTAAYIF